ncbi:hypothetical protein Afil01_56260 [Actinorhabdospora filicis]|uniref:Methylamine utilisation protein MauE domain-containing protein n=1 Tax=Actinorhabdospora filicis TaxID=1785913 RepID=A0A9W6SPY8_9ACTN|nr:MauE/DoxX family redox-associated membrane protein [Actinorhabdospora filicis]GLZ80819.1 hypothetical protein Afil01_56260 [Actinorhabdospora filicis]
MPYTVQALVLGAVLAWSGALKLFSRYAPAEARRTALAGLLGEKAVPAHRVLGGAELALAALFLAPPALTAEAVAGIALTTGFLAYLTYAAVAAPDASCGCLGSRPARVTWRAFARAGTLLAAAVLALFATGAWYTSILDGRAIALVIGELALVAALSPELDHHWLTPLRRLRVRLTHPLASGVPVIPLDATVTQLVRSGAWRATSALVTSDVTDHWDEGEWRFLAYTARYDGEAATAVYAVPRLRYDPGAVRAALVAEDGATLYAVDGPPPGEVPSWALTVQTPEHVRT